MIIHNGNAPPCPAYFTRIDETDDRLFYAEPRIVTHIDDNAIAAIQAFFDQVFELHSEFGGIFEYQAENTVHF